MDLSTTADLKNIEVADQQMESTTAATEADLIQDPEAWPVLKPDAIYDGFIKRFVDAACENSEADPAAVLMTFLTRFAVEVGRNPFMWIGDGKQRVNLLTAVVGATGNGRKGTSAKPVDRLFNFDATDYKVAITTPGPLSSGEGLINAVRDKVKKYKKEEWVTIDPGVEDKRLYVQSEELASAFKAMQREGNTLSTVIRQVYDSGSLAPLTKSNKITATGAHIGIVGHITVCELESLLDQIEFRNGFTNRFLWVCSRRQKNVPFPKPIPDQSLTNMQTKLLDILRFSREASEMSISDGTRKIWAVIYPELSKGQGGIIGDVLGRATNHVIRLSMLHALMDSSATIEPCHVKAALAIWSYCEQSARYIFESQAAANPVQKKIIDALQAGPKTATDIYKFFQNHVNSEKIKVAIKVLMEQGRILNGIEKGAGRSTTTYFLQKEAA